jgi:hypothetical protein
LIDALRRFLLRRPLRSSSRGLYFAPAIPIAPAIWIGWLLPNAPMRGR